VEEAMRMKIAFTLLGIFLGAGLLFATQTVNSRMRRAFNQHEEADKLGYPEFKEERFLNFLKDAHACPTVSEVTKVIVTKTGDAGQYVIVLFGPDADTSNADASKNKDVCSLWLNGERVRAITTY
jgi:hypothetical protein